jgi:[ribosomal protein S5]-alanine N-acetyltransferase
MTDPLNAKILTKRLRLEPQLATHASAMMHVLGDPRTHEFIPTEPPQDEATLRERFRKLESRHSPDGTEYWLNWVVFLEDQAVGTVQASATTKTKNVDIAYVFHPDYWGNGYAIEAVRAMLIYLQTELQSWTFSASIDTRNTASQRLLEKLDFIQTGYLENADEFKGSVSHEYSYRLEVSTSDK